VIWGDKLHDPVLLSLPALSSRRRRARRLLGEGEVLAETLYYDDIAKHGGKPVIWKTPATR